MDMSEASNPKKINQSHSIESTPPPPGETPAKVVRLTVPEMPKIDPETLNKHTVKLQSPKENVELNQRMTQVFNRTPIVVFGR